MVRHLKEKGFEVIIADNLSYGHIESVKDFDVRKIDLVTEKENLMNCLKKKNSRGYPWPVLFRWGIF